jgi:hypothetical protein
MTILLLLLMEIPEVGSRYKSSAGGIFFSFAEIDGVLCPFWLGILSYHSGSFES